MFKSKLSKVIVSLLRRIAGVTRSGAKRLMRAMLQALMAMGRRARLPMAGFVLPTVTMVLLVVILLTVAITLRSFDRANTARNVRVNQQVLAAATPALDRAKAKIQFLLLEDPRKPLATPSDPELYRLISDSTGGGTGIDNYTFGDETRLKLKADLDGNGSILSPDLPLTDTRSVEINESINTAWRYAVDTNNDGKYDTFTLYGIFFRSPPRIPSGANAGEFTRPRKTLEARTPPMSLGVLKKGCEAAAGNSASLVGDSSWYSMNGRLSKSFFVYTVNVPITASEASSLGNDYKAFTGTSSISALEYQQDQSRIPLSNNAVVYEDDLEISPGPPININGRMVTNSNLIVSGIGGDDNLKLYQVSSQNSCFYEQENSKIIVGGNVVNGGSGDNFPSKTVQVHLFKKPAPIIDQKISATVTAKKTGQSVGTSSKALDVLYNNAAFQDRISLLVGWQSRTKPVTDDPLSVQKRPTTQSREQALENYFKLTTRKVPFAEIAFGGNGIDGFDPLPPAPAAPTGASPILGSGESLRPIDRWNLPLDANTNLSLNLNQLEATEIVPNKPIEEETYLGDRVVAGNSLPNKWWDSTKSELVSTEQPVAGKWNTDTTQPTRTRTSQITQLADVGATDRGNGLGEKTDPDLRDGFWEASAARIPKTIVDGIGGLRVITSAGVYDRRNSFLPPPVWLDAAGTPKYGRATINDSLAAANTYDDPAMPGTQEFPVVWPDTMPMSPLGKGSKVYNNNAAVGSSRDSNWIDFPGPTDGSGLPTGVAATTTSPVVEIAANNPQYAKGDLRMRASAVYHYAEKGYKADDIVPPAQPVQEPIACVSSYYDPSSALTALNLDGLANVSGQGTQSPAVLAGLPALGGAQPKFIGSNNGITYSAPTTTRPTGASTPGANGLLTGGNTVLDNQANLVFPDGRFANGPLRSALQVADTERTLAQKAAIDSTLCALDILKGAITPAPAKIPHGVIQEVAFLDAREIKAVDRDDPNTNVNEAFTLSSPLVPGVGKIKPANLTGDYNQPIEERQPLEIRATQIDLDQLRKKVIAQTNATGPSPEYLLPNSGIIYASRDDALPDRSDRTGDEKTSKRVSPSDSLLDPTRKPNGIVLINGKELFRGTTPDVTSVTDLVKQKGLILVSNVPVYIKGEFNLHTGGTTGQEFEQALTGEWTEANFYEQRIKLNDSFACRKGDPRLKACAGDNWRQATVLADAVTLLSKNYRFGFRNEGDFDLRNNVGAAAVLPRKQQGFFNNNFVTNGLTSGAFSNTGNLVASGGLTDASYKNVTGKLDSSYFTNFATPVQRRANFPEYLMEVCIKLPVSECKADDWYVDPLAATPVRANTAGGGYAAATSFKAGTTATPPALELQRFPRRVAFKRDAASGYALTGEPLGITAAGNAGPGRGEPKPNSLWFATVDGASINYNGTSGVPYALNTNVNDWNNQPLPNSIATPTLQPLLMPVDQLQTVKEDTGSGNTPPQGVPVKTTGWITRATETTFNLIIGSGDIPSRKLGSTTGDFNGGLQNLPRFLESWNNGTNNIKAKIQGSFVQLNRSAYSTGPYQPILPSASPQRIDAAKKLKSLFTPPTATATPPPTVAYTPLEVLDDTGKRFPGYKIDNIIIPFFIPPARDWGFDVGQLSQPPDLFTQRFTTPPRKTEPAEYFREVPRNDEWVTTLMCGVIDDTPATKATETLTPADRAKCPS
ncbi:hormogonium polysaccharide biosynthesis protein HpsA [Microcoleus sp. Pol7_A1]|uniref:hormogonium polysaccharide biosynthesis protein HpsA n=1 Tax=Microcoleus sp. Pol7_A1 TaxID=2818893 RepID=UPI002FD2556B